MKLIQGLLYNILDNVNTGNKYSKAFLNLKNVIELEQKEKVKLDKEIIKKFSNLEKKYNSFMNQIPLQVIETYFRINSEKLNEYIYIEYNNNELCDIKVIDLFIQLELYFEEIFSVACEIANFYNLEVKLKGSKNSDIEMI